MDKNTMELCHTLFAGLLHCNNSSLCNNLKWKLLQSLTRFDSIKHLFLPQDIWLHSRVSDLKPSEGEELNYWNLQHLISIFKYEKPGNKTSPHNSCSLVINRCWLVLISGIMLSRSPGTGISPSVFTRSYNGARDLWSVIGSPIFLEDCLTADTRG